MSTWIEVNGARLEKDFFDENVREVKGYNWGEIRATALAKHVHCMICGVTIDLQSSTMIRKRLWSSPLFLRDSGDRMAG